MGGGGGGEGGGRCAGRGGDRCEAEEASGRILEDRVSSFTSILQMWFPPGNF